MKMLSRWLSRFCYDHPRFGIPELMKYIVFGNVAVFVLDLFSQGTFSAIIAFYPSLIFRGQIWRLATFVFVPMNLGSVWFIFSTMLYFFLGTTLERQWGTARFSLFYLLGTVLNVLAGFALYFALGQPAGLQTANMYYVNMSMFFAFATLYPDTEFRVYFILPVKVKWLAWLDAAFFAFDIGYYLFSGLPLLAALPVVGLLNYFIFFWDDLADMVRRGGQRAARRVNPQTINFKRAQREVQHRRGYLHKCAVCGLTDADNPSMEFRYCSKCSGYYCYCMDHINNHVHVQ
ncbi:MAG: rhomboid family intramembrane serine protease [Lawsonibacter sp.]|nr:rhomboid family intramembrane serine protease [Lawsonibacter sp.]